MTKDNKQIVPIFFATDDNYIPCLTVAIKSLLDNASKDYFYNIHILHTGLTEFSKNSLIELQTANSEVIFKDLSKNIERIKERLNSTLRDYYTESIFYRLFIASLYPEYDKAIYLDGDIVVLDDIVKLYNIDLKENILGAVVDDVIGTNPDFRVYANEGVGVDYEKYFNSGVLLMNLVEYRKQKIQERFVFLLVKHNFETAAPDQDYLNVLCKNKVYYLEKGWDKMSTDENYLDKLYLIHYNNFRKPWYYDDVPYARYFWEYAKRTKFYDVLQETKNNFTEEHAEKHVQGAIGLVEMTKRIVASDKNFKKVLKK